LPFGTGRRQFQQPKFFFQAECSTDRLIPALAYVDEIVSDDGFFHKIYPVAQKTGYVRAKLINFDEFLKRF